MLLISFYLCIVWFQTCILIHSKTYKFDHKITFFLNMGSCLCKLRGLMHTDPQNNTEVILNRRTREQNSNTQLITDNRPFVIDSKHSRFDDSYKMNGKMRGLLLIFNHENFEEETKLVQRQGTDRDVEKIRKTFTHLGFEIHCYKDLTLSELRDQIKEYVKQDYYHKQRDCLVIFILTHGDKGILWAKDASYKLSTEIWERFANDKCPSFAGKPKIIFLQACQGKAFQGGVKLLGPSKSSEFDGSMVYEYPTHADLLIVYATFEGYYAFRNDLNGSFFLTILCEELEKRHRHTDLLSILTIVNRRMAVEFSSSNSSDRSKHGWKQIPYFKSSLTRKIIFGQD